MSQKQMLSLSARTTAAVSMPVCVHTPMPIADICVEPQSGNRGTPEICRAAREKSGRKDGEIRYYRLTIGVHQGIRL